MTQSTNPPPVKIPTTLMKDPAEAKYWREQKDALYLLWFNQSGSGSTPAPSDEFSRRYALLVHR